MKLIIDNNIRSYYVTDKPVRNNNKLNFIKFEDFDSDLKCSGNNVALGCSGGGKSVMFTNLVADYVSEQADLDCAGE